MSESVFMLTYHLDMSDIGELPSPMGLGIFATLLEAEDAIKFYLDKPGFGDEPDGFVIEEVILDEIEWKDGFDGLINIEENLHYKPRRPNTSTDINYSYRVYRRT